MLTQANTRAVRVPQLVHRRLAQAKKRQEALDARNKHRSDAYLNKDLDRKRKIADEKRRTDSYNSAKLAREVVNTRVGRLDSWGRESVERARAPVGLRATSPASSRLHSRFFCVDGSDPNPAFNPM